MCELWFQFFAFVETLLIQTNLQESLISGPKRNSAHELVYPRAGK